MADFSFNKGSDYTVFAEDIAVGGIKKMICVAKNSYSVISQFLTDVAVAKVPAKNYELTFVMNVEGENIFSQKTDFSRIDIVGKHCTVSYTQCYVTQIESFINASGEVEERVTVTAEERVVF